MPPRVATLILNWHDEATTIACVHATRGGTYPNQTVYVLDNAATPESRAALAGLAPFARLLESAENLGFTGGMNLLATAALADGADYLWLLNNDATPEPDTLSTLVAAAEADPSIGLVTPLICEEDGSCSYAGVRAEFASFSFPTTTDPAEARQWQAEAPGEMLLWGTALLIRRTLAERAGLLDPRFFAYCEDTDLSIRSLHAGFINHIAFDARVLHPTKRIGEAEVARHVYYLRSRNTWLLLRKHCAWRNWPKTALLQIRRDALLAARLGGAGPAVDAILAGYWDAMRSRFGAYDPNARMPRPLAAVLRRMIPWLPRLIEML
jgi:hypothetical protein